MNPAPGISRVTARWKRFDTDADGNPLRDVQSYYLRSRSRKNHDKI